VLGNHPCAGRTEPIDYTYEPGSRGVPCSELAIKQGSDPGALRRSINWAAWDTLPETPLLPTGESGGSARLAIGFSKRKHGAASHGTGGTEVLQVQTQEVFHFQGYWYKPLHFFQTNDEQIALQGVHALLEPGVYPLLMEATLKDGSKQSFQQMVLVTSGNYASEELYVPPETIDPVVSDPENQHIISITSPATSTRFWDGIFEPAVYPDRFTSRCGAAYLSRHRD
jgi:hypothetical protein